MLNLKSEKWVENNEKWDDLFSCLGKEKKKG
jgi:hypothetical protein